MAFFIKIFIKLSLIAYVLSAAIVTEDEECYDESVLATTQLPTKCPPAQTVSNVALRKTTKQSTTFSDFESSKAVDGLTTQQFFPAETCTHTSNNIADGDTRPWLIVDMGGTHVVQYVKLYSRSDPCCAERYHDLEIRVGSVSESGLGIRFQSNPVCDIIPGGGHPKGQIFHFNCPACMTGSYVSVQITEDTTDPNDINVLTICELEVYGYPVTAANKEVKNKQLEL